MRTVLLDLDGTLSDSRPGIAACFRQVGAVLGVSVLVITLKSSQTSATSNIPGAQALLDSTMLELAVLGGLILVMVVSIALLRRSERPATRR